MHCNVTACRQAPDLSFEDDRVVCAADEQVARVSGLWSRALPQLIQVAQSDANTGLGAPRTVLPCLTLTRNDILDISIV